MRSDLKPTNFYPILLFMKKIESSIEIDATPENVWKILVDLPGHSAWNTQYPEWSGKVELGGALKITFTGGARKMVFKPVIEEMKANRSLRYVGKLGAFWLFRTVHTCEITPVGSGCRFSQSEEFTGALVPLLWSTLNREARHGFEVMNQELKRVAEGKRSTQSK
jgi:hypothetical protein